MSQVLFQVRLLVSSLLYPRIILATNMSDNPVIKPLKGTNIYWTQLCTHALHSYTGLWYGLAGLHTQYPHSNGKRQWQLSALHWSRFSNFTRLLVKLAFLSPPLLPLLGVCFLAWERDERRVSIWVVLCWAVICFSVCAWERDREREYLCTMVTV